MQVERVVVLGRGGAGKVDPCARALPGHWVAGHRADRHFWSEDLSPLSVEAWVHVQEQLAVGERWIMDGDLGPYDAPAARLRRADTVVVLDLSLVRCAWRAAQRSRERADFWWWLLTWRWRSRSRLLDAVSAHAPQADLHVLHTPAQVRRLLATASTATP